MKMNYHNIKHDDMNNGDGIRVTLFVSGCNHHCKGCQNPQTWSVNGGILFDSDALNEICTELDKDYISGLTLSGGDPLHPANRGTITEICKKVKYLYPHKTIWLYTGYQYEDIKHLNVLNYIDVLVDGEYIEELRDISLEWIGSSNQRVIRLCK